MSQGVRSHRRVTNNSREENGLDNQVTSTANQGQGVRTQWPGSPWKLRPHHVSSARGDSGAGASHRTVQAWMDSEKKQPGKTPPEPKNEEQQAGKNGPTAGKKSIANCRQQTTNNHHSYRGPPVTDHSTRWKRRQAKHHRGADVFKDRKLSSRSSSRKPSRSLSQRRGRLDSEDRGHSSITVQ